MIFFDYDLPERLIAQHPTARRDQSRLLVVNRTDGTLSHRRFADLPEYLRPGDLLVRNTSRVLPARVAGGRLKTGGRWEGLFLSEPTPGIWEMLATTRGTPADGEVFRTDSGLTLTLKGRTPERRWLMTPDPAGTPTELLSRFGTVPLPPYIRRGVAEAGDRERYQTVYADTAGSVAAPTAGLHFTPELLQRLEADGIGIADVLLHVGLGTFASVKAADPTAHAIHAEHCEVTAAVADRIRTTKAGGGRILAVGTTTTRTLETAQGQPFAGPTALYIHPPYKFHTVDLLLTNFHLPKTTLLLLVQSLTGPDLLRRAYEEAIAQEYRFFSYGDAMLVLG